MFNIITMIRTALRYWRMAKDPETPKIVRYLIYAAIVYVISPLDFIPDVFPIAGFLDDATVLSGIVSLAMMIIPKDVKSKYDQKERMENTVQKVEGHLLVKDSEMKALTS